MKHHHKSLYSYVRFALAGTLVLAAVALSITATKISTPISKTEKLAYTPTKVDADSFYKGHSAETAVVAESKNPNSSPEIEAYLLRAYPDTEVSGDSTVGAQAGWAALNAAAHAPGSWYLVGPSKATYPTQLDPFLFNGAQYVASGRVNAIAINNTCKANNCVVYVGAAGGGVWKTTNALAGQPNWQFISGNFPAPGFAPGVSTTTTNAIGSILIDPNDSTGNTVYVGTGEENASNDSEAGVGVYKTTDGGNTWTLVPDTAKFFQRAIGRMDFDNAGNLLVPIGSAIRGVSSVTSGASSSAATGHPLITRGVYRCDLVSTCTLLRATGIRGSTTVKMDPTHPGVMYATFYNEGVFRSSNNGATWTLIAAPRQGAVIERDEFTVTTLPNGNTRMYVGKGTSADTEAVNPNTCPTGNCRAHFFKTDDASGAAVFTDITNQYNIGYCTGQCWYDNVVYSPKGNPDVVYLGGSFSYGTQNLTTNGRAWLLSTDAGASWSDLTQDSDPNHADAIHPDEHDIATVPGKPFQFITGSDGGLVGSDGKFADVSYKCASRGLSPAGQAYCQQLLSRVPNQQNNMNNFLSTLQFQSLSLSAQNPLARAQGGTQDNGTFQYNGSPDVWPQIIYGDGGNSGFMVTDDHIRFNTFTGQANDANFRNADPTKWVIISAPILSSPEGAYFYPPIIADPNAANAGSIFQGSFSVWRTQDWGGNQAYLEANCPEFTASATQPGCGDFVIIGDGVPSTQLNAAAWGSRSGGAVAWLQRTASNSGSMWAATGAGRVFITDNANDPAASVHYFRLDNSAANSPGRAISAMAVDPANANHAFVAYNGYNVNTPSQPGHVFDVTRTPLTSTAVFTDISYNLPDFPITALVRDDNTGDLYAGSDFGVMKLPFGTTSWVVAGAGLPAVEVAGLTINSGARVLYAATHGRSAWQMMLP